MRSRNTSRKASPEDDGEEPEPDNGRASPRADDIFQMGRTARGGISERAGRSLSGVYLARNLVNEPANILTPPEFVERLRALEAEGLKVEVVDERALRSLGMNAMLAVGQGSAQPSSAVVLRWNGAPARRRTDGNTLSLSARACASIPAAFRSSPSQGMEDMKGDMAGAAAVAGVMSALARRKAPVNAVGLVGLVENMPSGTATGRATSSPVGIGANR